MSVREVTDAVSDKLAGTTQLKSTRGTHHIIRKSKTKARHIMTVQIHAPFSVRDPWVEADKSLSLPLRSNEDCEDAKRSVRFAPSPNVVGYVTALSDLTAEEKNDTWWSPAAMKEIIRDAKTLGREAQSSSFIVSAFEKAHEKSQLPTKSDSSFDDLEIDPELVDYCRFGHSWRGLERSSSKLYNATRVAVSKEAKNLVIEMSNQGADDHFIRQVYADAACSARHCSCINTAYNDRKGSRNALLKNTQRHYMHASLMIAKNIV